MFRRNDRTVVERVLGVGQKGTGETKVDLAIGGRLSIGIKIGQVSPFGHLKRCLA